MGLPSKKQLHKHKRGTRKALDTLDAMDKVDDKTIDDEGVENLVEKKKSKKSGSKAKKKAAKNPEKTVEPEVQEETAKIELDEPESAANPTEHVSEHPLEDAVEPELLSEEPVEPKTDLDATSGNKEQENKDAAKKTINLDGLEEESFVDEKPEKASQELGLENATQAANEENMNKQDSSEGKTSKAESSTSETIVDEEYDEAFEDTQKDKYLTFQIGEESFGFSIKFITEIIVIHKITEVPDTPAFVRGVINLRGKVIPVIDVRHRFNMELREYDERTCIIVVDYEETAVGLIVDTVNEVADIPEDQIDPPPRSHSGIESSYIMGMGKIGKKVNILLNLEEVLFVDEILAKRRILEDS